MLGILPTLTPPVSMLAGADLPIGSSASLAAAATLSEDF